MEEINQKIDKIKKKLDVNGDGKVTIQEVVNYGISVAKEYMWMYLSILLAIIGYFKPQSIDDWKTIMSIAFILSSIIFGGYLKSNFQKQFMGKEMEKREVEKELEAVKNALNSAAIQNAELKISYLKNQQKKDD